MDLFRKPKKRNAPVVRKKESSSDEDQDSEVKDVIQKRRRTNPMVQSTKQLDASTRRADNSSDDSDDSDDNQDIAVATHSFAASGDAGPSGPRDQGATATLEVDTDYSHDAQAQFERVQQQLKEGVEKDGKILYKGSALYGAKEAKDTAKGNAASGYNRVGPVRAPQFLRQTVRWDFAPDICKDYKETGFCTFGDSCKFVHDRSDYKHGWEIDEEYEAGKYGAEDDANYEIHEGDDTFPEDCFICGNPFVDPIVTKCKHYFCTGCALKSFQKSSKCPICQQNTENIMNTAKELLTYLKRKKQQQKQEAEKQEEEKDSDDDEKPHECDDHHHHDHEDEPEEPENDSNVPEAEEKSDEEQEIMMEDVEGLEGGENDSESDDDDAEKD
ncbi:putative E3 ubiquitin-protein ligase rnf113 [Caenorhabditis elegans]|uniref:Probable E3 ubiquitin-protein ligase rnf113 n=1 Tax=Caenorhabditis elegans TaxID=6239 RepID=RN113_CAEEL|nr:putative E3 ubiquitin-protein ligase rnf113 [Caenorhabditis elegans]O17917.2 RecName: Full=Probable E3 ubiquitin-protein ligase rnf113; AltName: Full=RING finger protein 113 homolog [Caenorhabditis elegans]AAG50239.1 RING and zinc finger protein [Caenorhabditis elegans]CAB07242.2 Probable E3 ubiquitin-protein ligase rnf113 [Caenorhabditis elegans]|eukprot:NP_499375.1 Probable E3 ubiquitin-protein ligase rnf113 [Caenorhabditis elegans]